MKHPTMTNNTHVHKANKSRYNNIDKTNNKSTQKTQNNNISNTNKHINLKIKNQTNHDNRQNTENTHPKTQTNKQCKHYINKITKTKEATYILRIAHPTKHVFNNQNKQNMIGQNIIR